MLLGVVRLYEGFLGTFFLVSVEAWKFAGVLFRNAICEDVVEDCDQFFDVPCVCVLFVARDVDFAELHLRFKGSHHSTCRLIVKTLCACQPAGVDREESNTGWDWRTSAVL